MAKGKSIKAVWQCLETGLTLGVINVQKDKIKDLKRKKYNPTLRKYTQWKAKVAKNASK